MNQIQKEALKKFINTSLCVKINFLVYMGITQ